MLRGAMRALLVGAAAFTAVGLMPLAQVVAQGILDPNAVVQLLPALRSTPAPPWVQQGLRITYYSAVASVAGSTEVFVLDDNGDWTTPNGKKWRLEQGKSGASGHGYTQVNVVWLDRSVAALDIRSFTIPAAGLPGGSTLPYLQAFLAAVGPPGAGSDYWAHPQALQGALSLRARGLRVVRLPYRVGGRQYRAIRIQSVGGKGSQVWTYDENTGMLLHSGSSSVGGSAGIDRQGYTVPGAGLLTHNEVVDVRPIKLPWSSSTAPEWVGRLGVFQYSGAITTSIPGAGTASIPLSVTIQRRFAGPGWGRYAMNIIQGQGVGLPPHTIHADRVFGPAQVGGLWLAPGVLARLQPGQVLDRDPVTKMTLLVGGAGRTPQGAPGLSIVEGHNGQGLTYGYNLSTGMLVYLSVQETDPVTATRTQRQVQLVQRR